MTTPPLPEPKPVAYGLLKPDGLIHTELIGTYEDCEYWPRAEREEQSGWAITAIYTGAQLDAAVAAAQVPLTEAQINALPEAAGWWPMGLNDRIFRLIRAIERAHGIGEPT